GAGDRLTRGAGDRGARHNPRARHQRAPRRRLRPAPPTTTRARPAAPAAPAPTAPTAPTARCCRGGLVARRFTHGLAAVHAELSGRVVRPAAVGAGGHWRKCSTRRRSYGLPINSAN